MGTYSSHLCLYALIPNAVRTTYLAVRTSDFLRKKKVPPFINRFHKQKLLLNDSVDGCLSLSFPAWSAPCMYILKNCQNSSKNDDIIGKKLIAKGNQALLSQHLSSWSLVLYILGKPKDLFDLLYKYVYAHI